MKNKYPKAVFFFVMTYFFYSFNIIIISRMPYSINPMKIYFFQSLFALIILIPVLVKQRKALFLTDHFRLHVIRTLSLICSVFFFYSSLRLLPTIDAILVKNTSPFFLTILSILILKDRVSIFVWPLILLGFFGVYLVIGPLDSTFSFAHFYPLLASLGFACSALCAYRLLQYDTIEQVMLSLYLLVVLFLGPMVLWNWEPLPWGAWLCLASLGILSPLGFYCYMKSFTYVMPSRLAPYVFSELVFVYTILHVFFGVTLTQREILGGGVIISSMLIMFWLTMKKQEPSLD